MSKKKKNDNKKIEESIVKSLGSKVEIDYIDPDTEKLEKIVIKKMKLGRVFGFLKELVGFKEMGTIIDEVSNDDDINFVSALLDKMKDNTDLIVSIISSGSGISKEILKEKLGPFELFKVVEAVVELNQIDRLIIDSGKSDSLKKLIGLAVK